MSANNLSELFSQRIFRIPDYQRGYAWGEKQLSELWDDIDEIPVIDEMLKKHYTGTIYLEETTPSQDEKWLSSFKFFNVVDGQQRLTTISILLFELLKVTKDGYGDERKTDLITTYSVKANLSGESKVYKFSYSSTDKNYNFLLNTIFEDEKIILQNNSQNQYTKNLSVAKTFFRDKISLLNDAQKELLFKKITNSLLFDIRTIEKDLDVQAVFETMNNRGKPLSTLEKLKNRLIYLTEKLTNTEEDKTGLRKKINEAWGKIYLSLAQNPEHILDEDVFLSAHLSLYRKPKAPTFSEKLAEEKVFQMFCNKPEKYDLEEGVKEESVTYKKINQYIIELSKAAPIWYQIHNSKSKIIQKILILNSTKEVKIFLLSVLNQTSDANHPLFSNVEQLLFRNTIPNIWLMSDSTLATWARSIYNKEEIIDEIIQKTEGLINTSISVPNIINGFRHLFTYERGTKGFHRWGHLKYFLFEYEDFLKGKAKETNNKVTFADFEATSIEHIIPQHFSTNWHSEVGGFTDNFTDKDKLGQAQKVLLNTLGNLTILKNGKNSSLGNKSWKDKKERFRTGSYNEIDISKHDTWTSINISERGIEMLQFMQTKINGLTFTSDEMKKILFYDEYIIKVLNN